MGVTVYVTPRKNGAALVLLMFWFLQSFLFVFPTPQVCCGIPAKRPNPPLDIKPSNTLATDDSFLYFTEINLAGASIGEESQAENLFLT